MTAAEYCAALAGRLRAAGITDELLLADVAGAIRIWHQASGEAAEADAWRNLTTISRRVTLALAVLAKRQPR